jgi:hypothetical protein
VRVDGVEKIEVELRDVMGKLISGISSSDHILSVATAPFEKGIYFLKITSYKGKQARTVVKKVVLQ